MGAAGQDREPDKTGTHRGAGRPPGLRTIVFAIPPERIALFKAIIESYDNLATLRTEDPRRHHLKLYFSAENEAEVRGLLDSLRAQFRIEQID